VLDLEVFSVGDAAYIYWLTLGLQSAVGIGQEHMLLTSIYGMDHSKWIHGLIDYNNNTGYIQCSIWRARARKY
jgi:hypothetical protein